MTIAANHVAANHVAAHSHAANSLAAGQILAATITVAADTRNVVCPRADTLGRGVLFSPFLNFMTSLHSGDRIRCGD